MAALFSSPRVRGLVDVCIPVVVVVALLCLAHHAFGQEPVGPVVRHWAPPPDPGAYFWGWMILTGFVNSVFHTFAPKDVDAWAERNPRLAQLGAILRRMGFEPIALLAAVRDFFAGNPPPPGHAVAIGRSPYRAPAPPAPPPTPENRGMVGVRVLFALTAAILLAAGCALFERAQAPASTLTLCVADTAEQHPGLTLLEYVAIAVEDCGEDALAVLDAILASDTAAVKPLQPAAQDLRARGGDALRSFVAQVHGRIVGRQAARRAMDAGAGR